MYVVRVYLCMYVCINVFMYDVRINYKCIYVCMLCMLCLNACMFEFQYVCFVLYVAFMYVYICEYVCTLACIYVCLHTCTCIYVCMYERNIWKGVYNVSQTYLVFKLDSCNYPIAFPQQIKLMQLFSSKPCQHDVEYHKQYSCAIIHNSPLCVCV